MLIDIFYFFFELSEFRICNQWFLIILVQEILQLESEEQCSKAKVSWLIFLVLTWVDCVEGDSHCCTKLFVVYT